MHDIVCGGTKDVSSNLGFGVPLPCLFPAVHVRVLDLSTGVAGVSDVHPSSVHPLLLLSLYILLPLVCQCLEACRKLMLDTFLAHQNTSVRKDGERKKERLYNLAISASPWYCILPSSSGTISLHLQQFYSGWRRYFCALPVIVIFRVVKELERLLYGVLNIFEK